MKSCNRHIFKVSSSVKACVLKHCVLLKFFWTAAIEEAEHIVDCDAAIKNASSDKYVYGGIQAQLPGLSV